MLRKFCIINTCGSEDCGNHQQDHERGAYYLVQDVDAHLAAIEEADNIRHAATAKQMEAKDARIADLELAAKESARESREMRQEFERRGERIADLEAALRQARGFLANAAKARIHWEGCDHPECVILREIDSLMVK